MSTAHPFFERTCARCGKGKGLAAFTLLIQWAKDAGVTLKNPESCYLHPNTCGQKLRGEIRAAYEGTNHCGGSTEGR